MKVHETINSIGVVLALIISSGGLYFSTINFIAQREKISFSASLDESNFNSKIYQNDDFDGFYITLSYRLRISNLSTRSTSIIRVRTAYNFHNKKGRFYDDYVEPRKIEPINLEAGESWAGLQETSIPIARECFFVELRDMKEGAKFLDILKIFSENKKIFPDCISDKSYEPINKTSLQEKAAIPKKDRLYYGYDFFDVSYYTNVVFQIITAKGSSFVGYSTAYPKYHYYKLKH